MKELTQRRKGTKSQSFYKWSLFSKTFAALPLCVFALIFSSLPVAAQITAFLTPDKAESSNAFAEKLENSINSNLKLLDNSLAASAYLSVSPPTPFNLTTDESKRIGAAIGCDVFILVRSATVRRSAFQRAEYYEAYAAIYVVSSRTGRLIFWKLQKFEAAKPDLASKMLDDSAASLASEIVLNTKTAIRNELADPDPPKMEEVPDENSPAAEDFRAPVPYRRIKPEYTTQAALFDIKATVDLLVYLDEKGTILKTETTRWAGFGLDESVEKNVRSMNCRPAMRGGKPLAMKFLVRYNFKKGV